MSSVGNDGPVAAVACGQGWEYGLDFAHGFHSALRFSDTVRRRRWTRTRRTAAATPMWTLVRGDWFWRAHLHACVRVGMRACRWLVGRLPLYVRAYVFDSDLGLEISSEMSRFCQYMFNHRLYLRDPERLHTS